MNAREFDFGLLSGPDGLAQLVEEWEALIQDLPWLDVSQCPQWSAAYLSCLAPQPAALAFITVRRDGRLVAILPLERSRRGRGPLAVRELRTLTHDHMTLADIVAQPLDSAIWPALVSWMQSQSVLGWDRLLITHLKQDSVLGGWLSGDAELPGQARPVDGSAWLDCDRGYEALLKSASSNHRSVLSRGQKKAREMGELRYETFNEPSSLAEAMPHFLAIEASGWKGSQGGAVSCRPELIEFYNQLIRELGSRGRCEIDLLWLGDRLIASIFWFRTGGQLHLQKIAYLEEVANIGPGRLIMAEALQRACADPSLLRVSFITRCPWADGWRTEITPVWRHVLYPRTLRGQLARWMDQRKEALKAWVKSRRERGDKQP